MKFTFGKYKNKSVLSIMVNDPLYIYWILSEFDTNSPICGYILKATDSFDKTKMKRNCSCGETATQSSLYSRGPGRYGTMPYFVCNFCDPYKGGASYGVELTLTARYYGLIDWMKRNQVSKADCSIIMKNNLAVRGLTGRMTQKKLQEVFCTKHEPSSNS